MPIVAFDYLGRLRRADDRAVRVGLEAVVVAPGPDLLYLAGYEAPPLERLTALVVRPGKDPVLLVPELERPRAEASPARELMEIEWWPDGGDQYQAVANLVPTAGGSIAVSDRL